MFVNKFDEYLFFLILGIDVLVTLLFSGLVGTFDFGMQRCIFLIICLIIAAWDYFCHVRNKKHYEREYTYDISKKSFFVFIIHFLIFFGICGPFLIEFIEKKNSIIDFNINRHYIAPFVFRYVILFYTISSFITDFTLLKRKVYKSVISFLPILFLLPSYLGLWANDKSIIRIISVCVACLISFNLNIKTLLKAIICISFSTFILLIPNIDILPTLCILISSFLILQFAKEKKNNFVITVFCVIVIIRLLTFTFPVAFNILDAFSKLFSKISTAHISGDTYLGLSFSGYELFIAVIIVTVFFIMLTKNLRYAYPLVIFSFAYSVYLQGFPILLEHFTTVALNFRFILLLVFCGCLFSGLSFAMVGDKSE